MKQVLLLVLAILPFSSLASAQETTPTYRDSALLEELVRGRDTLRSIYRDRESMESPLVRLLDCPSNVILRGQVRSVEGGGRRLFVNVGGCDILSPWETRADQERRAQDAIEQLNFRMEPGEERMAESQQRGALIGAPLGFFWGAWIGILRASPRNLARLASTTFLERAYLFVKHSLFFPAAGAGVGAIYGRAVYLERPLPEHVESHQAREAIEGYVLSQPARTSPIVLRGFGYSALVRQLLSQR